MYKQPTSDDSSRIEICSEEEAKTDISYPSRTASQLDYLFVFYMFMIF